MSVFKDKKISDLADYTFHIPSYQRGYRWGCDQVLELLNDLKVFFKGNPSPKESYWLQPIVVKKKGETEFELIDGQQRLTTLFLLSRVLGKESQFYKLLFDKRDKQNSYINNEQGIDWKDNIDTYYMHKAFEQIKEWCDNMEKEDQSIYDKIRYSIIKMSSPSPKISVIWYELDGNEIDAFERLNHGRIKLTGTELVKSLLLVTKEPADNSSSCQDDAIDDDEEETTKEEGFQNEIISSDEANRRGHAWDRIEKALQEPYFWAIAQDGNNSLSHIEAVLNVVADDINNKYVNKRDKRDRKKDEEMFNYYVARHFFDDNHTTKEMWDMIESVYNRMRNWNDNDDWYNYIALGKRIDPKKFTIEKLREKEKSAMTKSEFKDNIRKMVKDNIKDHRTEDEKANDIHILDAENLNYNSQPNSIRNILLMANVIAYMDEKKAKFPFHIYDDQNITSLEHIHPQNIAEMTSTMSPADIRDWVFDRIEKIRELNNGKDSENVISETDNEQLNIFFDEKDDRMKAAHIDTNDENWQNVLPIINKIDKVFGEFANIKQGELHSIKNMALVTQPANSALSNNYLDRKRKILIERKKTEGEYLMPLTERVFAKYYTAKAGKDTGDMRLWGDNDREEYMKFLKEAYDGLTQTPSKQENKKEE